MSSKSLQCPHDGPAGRLKFQQSGPIHLADCAFQQMKCSSWIGYRQTVEKSSPVFSIKPFGGRIWTVWPKKIVNDSLEMGVAPAYSNISPNHSRICGLSF